ncbi:ATP-dependent helicase [Corynebacterium sp. HMSC29G08]|uniref:ATP-dependent helicase n=1 Tax=Corynebacterium sp. HMSC29G08 TaxID=1581069 RepID=UPI000B0D3C29|nr:UvrD-helicase domain-containing protein [Corynebacterium sp. HMSC29G08]
MSNAMPQKTVMPPKTLSAALKQKFPPTPQQADVIGADLGPLLVVAGAGAGKTETMAARVVWLVANGFVRPDQVLGLTFTRKAARELDKRIRDRLATLAADSALVARLDPTGELGEALEVIAPTVSTYDAYAGDLIREYGLLVPVEPDARLITDAELHAVATDVVANYSGRLLAEDGSNRKINSVVENLLGLVTSMGNELADPKDVAENASIFLKETEELTGSKRTKGEYSADMTKWRAIQQERAAYLPLAAELQAELRRRGVVTFNEQMSVAAAMARDHAQVGESQRRRFKVVMLDEYQDTSHAQRVLLTSLFGKNQDPGLTVTAVGDPMQAIYTWRGATAANLAAFVSDFPQADGSPAPKKQLTTSWRNPPEVLELANGVSDEILGTGQDRAVEPLQPREGADAGRVQLGYFNTQDEEITFVADELQRLWETSQETGEAFKTAVLVRKNRHTAAIAEALEARGVPYEIVGVAGLLAVPEVADTVAIATMLVRPGDSAAALRVLGGRAVGLGLADLQALAARAENLRARERGQDPDNAERAEVPAGEMSAQERLQRELEDLVDRAAEVNARSERCAGLADAVADLGEPERYSDKGLARLKDLSAKLRWLRTHSLGKRLADLFADIMSVFNIRTEVLARDSVTRAAHLDRLLDEVAKYPGSSPDGLLDYFDLARSLEDGLEPGNVSVQTDRVQLLTAHKAKGLEWDTVAVLHADAGTYGAKAGTFLGQIKLLQDDTFADTEITPEFAEVDTRSQFEKAAKQWVKFVRGREAEESARLFYVAVTRSARNLYVTASRTAPGTTRDIAPYEHFAQMREQVDEQCVVTWWDGSDESDDTRAVQDANSEQRVGLWPDFVPSPEIIAAGEAVASAREAMPEASDADPRYEQWERDVSALIEEHEALQRAEVPVVLPGELTASDVVALRADAAQFARRARRPVPFKPNTYAKRGTAFHEWLEEFFGARPLLDENELPGSEQEDVDAAVLEQLKSSFEQSHWAGRTPAFVERAFELALGNVVVRGRIDAIFEDDEGWTVVDWKTGMKPTHADMEAAKLQLAVYREAWRRIAGDDKPVRAMFFYVRTGEDFAPRDLPGADELAALIAPEEA